MPEEMSRKRRASSGTAALATPATIGDFDVLPILIPCSSAFTAVHHHIYVRRNSPRNPSPDDCRSLFLANVPSDSTEAHVRAVFASLVGPGKFEGITFEDDQPKHGTGLGAAASHLPAQAARLARIAHGSSNKRKRDEPEEEDQTTEATAHILLETWPRRLRRSGSTAVVLLVDEKSASLVLKAIAKLHKPGKGKHPVPVWGQGVEPVKDGEHFSGDSHPLGTQWLRSHNALSFPSREAVQSAVDAFFVLYNRQEREAAEAAKRMLSEPDEDGFVTVTRAGGSRNQPARRDEAEEARRRMIEKEERKKAELGGFYRFQHREQKKAAQADLAKRFEEDRKKVAAMREKRGRFRPEA